MEIKEVKIKRKELQDKILNLIINYEKETGAFVDCVDLDNVAIKSDNGEERITKELRVNVSL